MASSSGLLFCHSICVTKNVKLIVLLRVAILLLSVVALLLTTSTTSSLVKLLLWCYINSQVCMYTVLKLSCHTSMPREPPITEDSLYNCSL